MSNLEHAGGGVMFHERQTYTPHGVQFYREGDNWRLWAGQYRYILSQYYVRVV